MAPQSDADLMFLSPSPLLFQFLLLLQLLCDPGLPHALSLGSFVRLQVQCRLECRGSTSAGEDLGTQLLLEVKEAECSELYHGIGAKVVRDRARKML